jgi:hypothetical protein
MKKIAIGLVSAIMGTMLIITFLANTALAVSGGWYEKQVSMSG